MNDTMLMTTEPVMTEDDKNELAELLDDLFGKVPKEEEELSNPESPEVLFAKFLWKIKFLEKEIETAGTTADRLREEISLWQEMRTVQKQKQIQYLCMHMENYLRCRNVKSMLLPNGTIGLRRQQPKIEIRDEDLFYKNSDNGLLRHIPESYEPDLKKIREHIKTTGEIPAGIDMTEQEARFYYKLK